MSSRYCEKCGKKLIVKNNQKPSNLNNSIPNFNEHTRKKYYCTIYECPNYSSLFRFKNGHTRFGFIDK